MFIETEIITKYSKHYKMGMCCEIMKDWLADHNDLQSRCWVFQMLGTTTKGNYDRATALNFVEKQTDGRLCNTHVFITILPSMLIIDPSLGYNQIPFQEYFKNIHESKQIDVEPNIKEIFFDIQQIDADASVAQFREDDIVTARIIIDLETGRMRNGY